MGSALICIGTLNVTHPARAVRQTVKAVAIAYMRQSTFDVRSHGQPVTLLGKGRLPTSSVR